MNLITKARIRSAVNKALSTYSLDYSHPPHHTEANCEKLGKKWIWRVWLVEEPDTIGALISRFDTYYLGFSSYGVVGNTVTSEKEAKAQFTYAKRLMDEAIENDFNPRVANYRFITDS